MSNPALVVAILIVCVVVPIAFMWWNWKERSGLAASLSIAVAVVSSVALICWTAGASWQTTLATLGVIAAGAVRAIVKARLRNAAYQSWAKRS